MKKLIACAFVFTLLGCLDTTSAMKNSQICDSQESLQKVVLSKLQRIYSTECRMCDLLEKGEDVLPFFDELRREYAPILEGTAAAELDRMVGILERRFWIGFEEVDKEFTKSELAAIRESSETGSENQELSNCIRLSYLNLKSFLNGNAVSSEIKVHTMRLLRLIRILERNPKYCEQLLRKEMQFLGRIEAALLKGINERFKYK